MTNIMMLPEINEMKEDDISILKKVLQDIPMKRCNCFKIGKYTYRVEINNTDYIRLICIHTSDNIVKVHSLIDIGIFIKFLEQYISKYESNNITDISTQNCNIGDFILPTLELNDLYVSDDLKSRYLRFIDQLEFCIKLGYTMPDVRRLVKSYDLQSHIKILVTTDELERVLKAEIFLESDQIKTIMGGL